MKARLDHQIAFCLTREMAQEVERVAAAEQIPISQFVRKITKGYLDWRRSTAPQQMNGHANEIRA